LTDYARWRDAFAQAMDTRLYSIEYLDALVGSMRAQIWFGDHAAIVTEVREYPTGARVIHGLVAAVDPGSPATAGAASPGAGLREIAETLIPRAEAWGRSIGCVLAIVESRAGWARQLKSQGYEPHQVTLRKELGGIM
jgi:hypothetical protein